MNNLERMIELADKFFEAKNDPEQISVDAAILERLHEIHPAAITQEENADGPIAWIMIIPTTKQIMQDFIEKKINEKELFDNTPLAVPYDAIYLCSALLLPEFRRQGIAKRLTIKAISAIQKNNPIMALFYWEFSDEGKKLALSLAKETGLPLLKRK